MSTDSDGELRHTSFEEDDGCRFGSLLVKVVPQELFESKQVEGRKSNGRKVNAQDQVQTLDYSRREVTIRHAIVYAFPLN